MTLRMRTLVLAAVGAALTLAGAGGLPTAMMLAPSAMADDPPSPPNPPQDSGGPATNNDPTPQDQDPEPEDKKKNKGDEQGGGAPDPGTGDNEKQVDTNPGCPGPEGTPNPNGDAPDGAGTSSNQCPNGDDPNDPNNPNNPYRPPPPPPQEFGALGRSIGVGAGGGFGAAPTHFRGVVGVNLSFTGNDAFIANLSPKLTYRSRVEFDGRFGKNWDLSLAQKVIWQQDGTFLWSTGEARSLTFTPTGSHWVSAPAYRLRLDSMGPGNTPRWVIKDKFGTKHEFNDAGLLIAIRDRWNKAVSIAYDSSGKIVVCSQIVAGTDVT